MKLFVFGLGYSARAFVDRHGELFEEVTGTVRDAEMARLGTNARLRLLAFGPDGADAAIDAHLAAADAILVSVPPGISTDPVLGRYGRTIAAQKRAQTILYLSTIGVYGDHGGAWVDEETLPTPKSPRSRARFAAEKAWSAVGGSAKRVHILRLSGIYGPGRNAFLNLKAGTARRLVKPGQVFNRIHVDDIAGSIAALLAQPVPSSVWNVTDDEPAPPQDVIAYAADLMGIAPPPDLDFATADLTPMARSFYSENKRVANARLKAVLGVTLTCPTYREGLRALFEAVEAGDPAPLSRS